MSAFVQTAPQLHQSHKNSHNLLFCDVDFRKITFMLISSVSETSLFNTRKDKNFANFAAVFSLALVAPFKLKCETRD